MEVLGILLPLSLGVAFSTVPLTAIVFILLSPRSRQSGPAFLAGWVLGLTFVTVAFVIGVAALPSDALGLLAQPLVGAIELILGGLLVAFGITTIVHKPAQTRAAPEWARRITRIGPWGAFGVAMVLNVRPKAIALALTAALAIGAARLSTTETVVVLIVYLVLGASTVIVPVVMDRFAHEATEARLKRMRGWLGKNSRVITIIVSLMVGVVIIGDGLGRF